MEAQDQIQLINDTINKTKENLKESSFNFIFWGLLIAVLSFFHYSFPKIVQQTNYSTLLYWVLIPVIGMAITVVYNIKKRAKVGFETYMGRTLKIIWGVFNISWILLIFISFEKKNQPNGVYIIFVRSDGSYNRAINSLQALFFWRYLCYYMQHNLRLHPK